MGLGVYDFEGKFKIGDKVRRYIIKNVIKESIICPLCGGKHKVQDPDTTSFLDIDEDDYLECIHCDSNGMYHVREVQRVLDTDIYEVVSVHMTTSLDGKSYRYGIHTTPEIDPNTTCCVSTTVDEDDLEEVN